MIQSTLRNSIRSTFIILNHHKISQYSQYSLKNTYGTNNSITMTAKSHVCLPYNRSYDKFIIMFIRSLSSQSAEKTANNSTDENENNEEKSKTMSDFDYDNYDDYEPRTAGEKVAVYTRLGVALFLLSLAGIGMYYTAEVLFPGRMSPFSLFSTASDKVMLSDEIKAITGEPMKAFGRDTANEGRRTNLDYRQFEEDGSKRTRIRFNIKGPKGQVIVWAEISNKMSHGEYVFLICQDKRTRKVITIEDKRDELEAARLALGFVSDDNTLYGKFFKLFGY